MKKLLAFAIIGLMSLSACGNDGKERDKVRECVEAGGVPYYSTSQDGFVTYITCDGLPG